MSKQMQNVVRLIRLNADRHLLKNKVSNISTNIYDKYEQNFKVNQIPGYSSTDKNDRYNNYTIFGLFLSAMVGTAYIYKRKVHLLTEELKGGERKNNLKDIRLDDIKKHTNKETGIWVIYKNGVYDITSFVDKHPGGNKVLLAAGGQLEPFWDMYTIHKNQHTMDWLESYRIGNLHLKDIELLNSRPKIKPNDPFGYEPQRHPALKVNSTRPFTAEPPSELLADNFITPNDLFFVRNHLGVPNIDGERFRLQICGKKKLSLSLGELKKKFKVYTITAAVQCAGNRRTELSKHKPVKGVSWGTAAISNATWTGVKLSDVLKEAGVSYDDTNVEHVHMTGLDTDGTSFYEASIPSAQALDPNKDVLLAYEMNGKPLSPDHGYPLRCIVPGSIGARQVKWLTKINVSDCESKSQWQQNDYKQFNPSIDWDTLDYSKAVALHEYPVQSVICEPKEGSKVDDQFELKGYAYSGGGRGIVRVDVSIDNGLTWHEANLDTEKQSLYKQWAWTLWNIDIDVPQHLKGKKFKVLCRATDIAHNTQPENTASVWNVRGLVNNSWHRIELQHEDI